MLNWTTLISVIVDPRARSGATGWVHQAHESTLHVKFATLLLEILPVLLALLFFLHCIFLIVESASQCDFVIYLVTKKIFVPFKCTPIMSIWF